MRHIRTVISFISHHSTHGKTPQCFLYLTNFKVVVNLVSSNLIFITLHYLKSIRRLTVLLPGTYA